MDAAAQLTALACPGQLLFNVSDERQTLVKAGMKITLAQYGGLAAGIHRKPRVLDAHALPTKAAIELAKLVAAAKAVPRPEGNEPGRARDAMSYTITIEDGGAPTLLPGSDTNMSPAFAALLNWLERYPEAK